MPRKGPKGIANPHAPSGQPRVKGRHREPQSNENAVLCEARAAVKRKRKGEKRLADTAAQRSTWMRGRSDAGLNDVAMEYQPDQ
jgi:hypothetical protein